MIDNQKGRRNLTVQQKLDLGMKRAELLKPKAEENRAEFYGNQHTGGQNLKSDKVQPVDTLQAAADYAGVSRDTASKYKQVMEKAPEEIKQRHWTAKCSPFS